VILEGRAPPAGSKEYNDLFEVMNKFQTLERPYTRGQLKKLLSICGFNHFKFYYPINGFFEEGIDNGQLLNDLSLQQAGNNNAVASRSADSMKRITESRCHNVIDEKNRMKALTATAGKKLKRIFSLFKPKKFDREIVSGPMEVHEVPDDSIETFMLIGDGWHGIEDWNGIPTRWIKEEAAILVNTPKSRTSILSLEAHSFYHPRTLEVFLDDEFVVRATIDSNGFTNVTAQICLAKGKHTLSFHVLEGCGNPSKKPDLNNLDSRCLSVALRNVKL
jgi:hypothetical protein